MQLHIDYMNHGSLNRYLIPLDLLVLERSITSRSIPPCSHLHTHNNLVFTHCIDVDQMYYIDLLTSFVWGLITYIHMPLCIDCSRSLLYIDCSRSLLYIDCSRSLLYIDCSRSLLCIDCSKSLLYIDCSIV